MTICLKKSFGGIGITIDRRGNGTPTLTAGAYELVEGFDYTILEMEKEGATQVVFEWMDNQSVYFLQN